MGDSPVLMLRVCGQARPEHSMVLRPNSAAESCSLTLEFFQPLSRSEPPSLIIEMANPRMLVLFRHAVPPTNLYCQTRHAYEAVHE